MSNVASDSPRESQARVEWLPSRPGHYLVFMIESVSLCSSSLLPAEHKAATQLLRLLKKDDGGNSKLNLRELLKPPLVPSTENISTLSALEIAEEMTFLDQQILFSICSQSVEPSLIKILDHDISISVSSWARPGINQTRKRELRTYLSCRRGLMT